MTLNLFAGKIKTCSDNIAFAIRKHQTDKQDSHGSNFMVQLMLHGSNFRMKHCLMEQEKYTTLITLVKKIH